MKKLALFLVVFACALAVNAQQARQSQTSSKSGSQPADSWAGTWKLNLAKSKFHGPAPKEETIKIEAGGANAVKYAVTGTGADGKQYTETYDGKPDAAAPLKVNGQEVGKVTYHRISSHKTAAEGQMADGSSVTEDITLAANGKSFTVKAHTRDAKGEHDQILVFTK